MTNPIHLDVNCVNNQVDVQPLSDDETTALAAEQAVVASALAAQRQAGKTLLGPVHAFARHPAPTDAMKEAALRAIITHFGLDS